LREHRARVRQVRITVIGLGAVGRWLLKALQADHGILARRYGFRAAVVAAANARDGFIHAAEGLDLTTLLRLLDGGRPISEHPGAEHWPTALDGLRATEADLLVEVSSSPSDGEPGTAHMREALGRGIPVATSNKWPVALHGAELAVLARDHGARLRAESTVMSGTPVLSTLTEGLAGARPIALRGILNATVNFTLTRMVAGVSYEAALAEAQEAGLAERDPSADTEGEDERAKLMILAGLVFGVQLAPERVATQGIASLTADEVDRAMSAGSPIRSVATLERTGTDHSDRLEAAVAPVALGREDPLAGVDGTLNALICRADPVGAVTVVGPGAGPELAGQGVLSDLIALMRGRPEEEAEGRPV
jgi:homoserine dehydrogenase